MQNARSEMETWRDYRYAIVNDELEVAYDALRAVVMAEHVKVIR
jgi:guanylate kinase